MLRALFDRERPGPQPARTDLFRRLIGETGVGGLWIQFWITQQVGGRGGVVPHGGLALDEEVFTFGEAGGRRARLTVIDQQVGIKLDCGRAFLGGELRLPVFVEPAATERIDDTCQRRTELAPPW